MFILDVDRVLRNYKVNYAIVGGYAVALHGVVRGTVDIDIIIQLNKSSMVNAEKALKELGLESKLPVNAEEVFNFRKEYIKNKNMLAWNFTNPQNPADSVDILITEDVKDYKINNIKIEGQNLKVISIDDLIRLKGKSPRPQDIEDVKALRMVRK